MNEADSSARTNRVVVPLVDVRPSTPTRGPEQIGCHPDGHTMLAMTSAQFVGSVTVVVGTVVVGTVVVGTGGGEAASFGVVGGTGRFATRRLEVRRACVILGRRAAVDGEVTGAGRAVHVSWWVESGVTAADGCSVGVRAAPAPAATTRSPAPNAMTMPTIANPRTDHMQWLSVPSHPS